MRLQLCEYVKMCGTRCAAPALSGKKFCRHHYSLKRLVPAGTIAVEGFRTSREYGSTTISMPLLDDAVAIQAAYMQIIHCQLDGTMAIPRARILLATIKAAARNLPYYKQETEQAQAAQIEAALAAAGPETKPMAPWNTPEEGKVPMVVEDLPDAVRLQKRVRTDVDTDKPAPDIEAGHVSSEELMAADKAMAAIRHEIAVARREIAVKAREAVLTEREAALGLTQQPATTPAGDGATAGDGAAPAAAAAPTPPRKDVTPCRQEAVMKGKKTAGQEA